MAPAGVKKKDDKGVGEVVNDLWQLVRDYAKQETIDPLKSIGRFLAWGVAGSVMLSLGLIFGTLAVLRVLQSETGKHLTGSLTFIPYLVALVVDAIAIGLAVRSIKKPMPNQERRS